MAAYRVNPPGVVKGRNHLRDRLLHHEYRFARLKSSVK